MRPFRVPEACRPEMRGRAVLECTRHRSISAFASSREVKTSPLSSSSRNLLLDDSTCPLADGVTQTMNVRSSSSDHMPSQPEITGPNFTVKPDATTATELNSLIRMFSDGPEVSLNGSPTVSPTTVAL